MGAFGRFLTLHCKPDKGQTLAKYSDLFFNPKNCGVFCTANSAVTLLREYLQNEQVDIPILGRANGLARRVGTDSLRDQIALSLITEF